MGIPREIFGKQLWIALVLVAAVVLFVGLIFPIFIGPKLSLEGADEPQPPPGIPTSTLVESALEQFESQYGSWLTVEESLDLRNQTGVRNFALLFDDGDVRYSARSVAFTATEPWRISRPPEVIGVDVSAMHVDIRNQLGNIFFLNVTQPFVFSGQLSRVYTIDENRQVWSAPIEELGFVDAGLVSDPSIPPNPKLSPSFGN